MKEGVLQNCCLCNRKVLFGSVSVTHAHMPTRRTVPPRRRQSTTTDGMLTMHLLHAPGTLLAVNSQYSCKERVRAVTTGRMRRLVTRQTGLRQRILDDPRYKHCGDAAETSKRCRKLRRQTAWSTTSTCMIVADAGSLKKPCLDSSSVSS